MKVYCPPTTMKGNYQLSKVLLKDIKENFLCQNTQMKNINLQIGFRYVFQNFKPIWLKSRGFFKLVTWVMIISGWIFNFYFWRHLSIKSIRPWLFRDTNAISPYIMFQRNITGFGVWISQDFH